MHCRRTFQKGLVALMIVVLNPLDLRCEPGGSENEKEIITLSDAYDLALERSERLQRYAEDIRAAEARYREAIAAIYPELGVSATQRFRNGGGNTRSVITGDVNNDVGSGRTRSRHPFESSVNVRQPLFTGFREEYISEGIQAEIQALEQDRRRGRQLLFQDVASVFYQVLYYQQDLRILERTSSVLEKRIAELAEFAKLGKSRDSEILAARADLADIGAARARVQGLIAASREMLSFLTGKPAVSLALEKEAASAPIPELIPLIAQSQERPDIVAQRERARAAENEVIARMRERWPTLAIEGSYFPYEQPDTDRDWEVLLRFDLPLYEGGAIDARVDQSRARQRSALLSAQENRRIAEREVRTLHSEAAAASREIEKLTNLLSATRQNSEAQRRDYELGVVTNLEVLASIRNVLNAERRLIDVQTSLAMTLARLKVAAGEIS